MAVLGIELGFLCKSKQVLLAAEPSLQPSPVLFLFFKMFVFVNTTRVRSCIVFSAGNGATFRGGHFQKYWHWLLSVVYLLLILFLLTS